MKPPELVNGAAQDGDWFDHSFKAAQNTKETETFRVYCFLLIGQSIPKSTAVSLD
jgi:hypothetical protein